MDNNLNKEVLDKVTKVCVCKSITRGTIIDAIKNGAHTVEDVKTATGAAGGACKGFRCKNKIEELIKEYSN